MIEILARSSLYPASSIVIIFLFVLIIPDGGSFQLWELRFHLTTCILMFSSYDDCICKGQMPALRNYLSQVISTSLTLFPFPAFVRISAHDRLLLYMSFGLLHPRQAPYTADVLRAS